MLINNEQKLEELLSDLVAVVTQQKEILFDLNRKITLDTDFWINKDFEALLEYLKQFSNFHYSPDFMIKPKGRVFIILSYNEPLILSVIPILNALVVGNEVVVKLSRGVESFFRTIWTQELLRKYKLSMRVSTKKNHEIEFEVQQAQCVYFFGSLKVAKQISELCGRNYTEFHPETETSDIKVFKSNQSYIGEDTLLTLEESFSHSGQTCQRIQGIFIHKDVFGSYVESLEKAFKSLDLSNFITEQFLSERKQLIEQFETDLKQSNAETVMCNNQKLPLIVVDPNESSKLVTQAYFLPVLWVMPFDSTKQLIERLNSRKLYLGVNLQSNRREFTQNIIEKTKFSRYTVNKSHTYVRPYEGWGGSWPSGFSGYRDWIFHFSNPYVVIND